MPNAVRVTKGPSTSPLTETEEEASHDETMHMKSQNHSKRYLSIILILIPHNQSTLI